MRWHPGDVICLRQIWRGRVWQATSWIVVVDEPDELVLYASPGTESYFPPSAIPAGEWTLTKGFFQAHALRLVRPRATYSTLLYWDADWTLLEWYVNFERPLRRSPVGFDYFDRALDLVCRPDGTSELLDEGELEALQRGVLTDKDASAARADAARIIEEWPFPTGWEEWRPDPSWPLLALPDGWDRVA